MCLQGTAAVPRGSLSPVAVRFARLTILLAILCFTQCAAGGNLRPQTAINKKKISSCLSYGHSCWGAHGKRNGNETPSKNPPAKDELPISDIPIDARWFLSRLYPAPPTYRVFKGKEGIAPEQRYSERQLLKDNADLSDVLKSMVDDEGTESQDLTQSYAPYYQDESYQKDWKENQIMKFLNNQKFNQLLHN